MAVLNGWLSSSCGYDLSTRFGVVNSSDCHFNWEVPLKQFYFDTRKVRKVLVTSWIFFHRFQHNTVDILVEDQWLGWQSQSMPLG